MKNFPFLEGKGVSGSNVCTVLLITALQDYMAAFHILMKNMKRDILRKIEPNRHRLRPPRELTTSSQSAFSLKHVGGRNYV